jgi:hypothetical protein
MEARFSALVQTGRSVHASSNGIRIGSLFRGVKRPGRGVNYTPPSSAEVKERVGLYSPYVPLRLVLGPNLPFYLYLFLFRGVIKNQLTF